jgi:hypothetical protein
MNNKFFKFLVALVLALLIAGIFIVRAKLAYVITIENQSSVSIESIRIYGEGGRRPNYWSIPILKSGERVKRAVWISHEGGLEFEAYRNQGVIQGEVDGYVTGNMGGGSDLIITDQGYKSAPKLRK